MSGTTPYFDLLPRRDRGADSDDESDMDCDARSLFSARMSQVSSSTSYGMSDGRAPSPSFSVTSMTSSIRAQAFRTEFGRSINNNSDVYRLPADEEELERLDRQHLLFMGVMGKYPPPLPGVLSEDLMEVKSVLDLGCGSGAWIIDVARDFPHTNCVAVDLVPLQSTTLPPNCRIEVDDINLGLEHFYGDFNLVHARFLSAGIRHYDDLIRHIALVLKPGGLLQFTEIEYRFYDVNRKPLPVDGSAFRPPWVPLWIYHMKRAATARGADVGAADKLRGWVVDHGAFEDIVERQFWIPSSPWPKGDDPEAEWLRRVGEVVREDFLALFRSGRPLLLGSGLSEEYVDTLENNARQELNASAFESWFRIYDVYATRRSSPST